MAGPWEKYQQQTENPLPVQPEMSSGPWSSFAPPAQESVSGSLLPFTRDASGVHFDSNAGIVGAVKRAFMAPGDAYTGQLQVMDAAGNVTPEAIGRSLEFASTFSPVNPGVGSGDRAIPGILRASRDIIPEAPTAEALKAAGNAGYNQMREMGVDYSSSSIKGLADAIRAGLDEQGFISEVAPQTASVLAKLSNPPENSVAPLSSLDAARKAFGKIGGNFQNPSDQAAASIVKNGIDEFILAPPEGSVVAGPSRQAAQVLRDARANTAASYRANTLADTMEAAELQAASANSGQNIGNALRQRAKNILLSDKASAGFNADELAALKSVVNGTAAANTTRFVGNLLGGGGGLGSVVAGSAGALGAGAASGNPMVGAIGALVPVLGFATKKVSNALTQKGLNAVSEATRMRSPLYEQAAASAGQEVVNPAAKAAIIRALLAGYGNQNTGGGGGF